MAAGGDAYLHFDRVAGLYGSARPDYPPALFEQLQTWGALREESCVLELGPGSGQATKELLARGVRRIDALEIGGELARELSARLPDPRLHIRIGDAHTMPLPEQAYDLCVAATSFHWLDATLMVPRLAAAMQPGSWLAVWWTEYGDSDRETPFRTGLRHLERRYGLYKPGPPRPLQVEDRLAELMHGELFDQPRHRLFRWSVQMTSAQVHDLFQTFPTFAAQPEVLPQIAQLVEELGGTITDHFITALYAVQRTTKTTV